jgi:hypothetical protein
MKNSGTEQPHRPGHIETDPHVDTARAKPIDENSLHIHINDNGSGLDWFGWGVPRKILKWAGPSGVQIENAFFR